MLHLRLVTPLVLATVVMTLAPCALGQDAGFDLPDFPMSAPFVEGAAGPDSKATSTNAIDPNSAADSGTVVAAEPESQPALPVNVDETNLAEATASATAPGTLLLDQDSSDALFDSLVVPTSSESVLPTPSSETVDTSLDSFLLGESPTQPGLDGPLLIEAEPIEVVDEPSLMLAMSTSVEDEDTLDIQFGDWLGYNATASDVTWVTGNADELGMFSLESYPALRVGELSSLLTGSSIHFLNGPVATDMPARLYDFQLAFQSRRNRTKNVVLDYRVGIGAFSDFEGSARKGIRFPGHAVTYYQWHPRFVSVFGIESLDRDDVSVLPVVGFVWQPAEDIVWEAVFPRPKLSMRLSPDYAMTISGELGGGTWAVERVDGTNDNATIRDFRVMVGFINFDDSDSAFEIGWAFGRKLEYRSSLGNYHPDDALVIRMRSFF